MAEAYEENRQLRRLIAHANILDSVDREQQQEDFEARERAYQAGLSTLPSVDPPNNEMFSCAAITAALDDLQEAEELHEYDASDEDSSDDSDSNGWDEDDVWSLESGSSSDSAEDEDHYFCGTDEDVDIAKWTSSTRPDDRSRRAEEGVASLAMAPSKWPSGTIEVVDIDGSAAKSSETHDGEVVVEIAECMD